MVLDANKLREDFHLFETTPELVYLDSAATSQTPNSVMRRLSEYYLTGRANIHRGLYSLSEEATKAYEDARKNIAAFINAKPEEIVFTGSATLASNMLVRSLEETYDIQKGDEIVVSIMEHHSVVVPLLKLAERRGCSVKFIPLQGFSLDTKKALSLITPKTKIVAVTLASNVLGTVNDVEAIVKKARSCGAISIVDAAQAVGHIPVDVRALGVDLLFFSGHKMCGPTGVGVLYGRKELLDKLQPSVFGGGAVAEVTKTSVSFLDAPQKFEAGTPPIASAMGLSSAIDYLNTYAMQDIFEHTQELYGYAYEALSKISGVALYGEKDAKKNAGIISFNIQGAHPHDVAEVLSRSKVAVRAGHHCAMPLMEELGISGTVRMSFYLYNTPYDIDECVKGVEKTKKMFS